MSVEIREVAAKSAHEAAPKRAIDDPSAPAGLAVLALALALMLLVATLTGNFG